MALKDVREVKEENTLNEKLFLLACDKGESSAPFSAPDALVIHSPLSSSAALAWGSPSPGTGRLTCRPRRLSGAPPAASAL